MKTHIQTALPSAKKNYINFFTLLAFGLLLLCCHSAMAQPSSCQSSTAVTGSSNLSSFWQSVTMDGCTHGNYFYSFEWQNAGLRSLTGQANVNIYEGEGTDAANLIYTQPVTFDPGASVVHTHILEYGTGTLEFTPGDQYTFQVRCTKVKN